MSNISKSNSRFASLIDDIPLSTKKEQRKAVEQPIIKPEGDKFNRFKSEKREEHFNNKKDRFREEEFNVQERKKKINDALDINNFPELGSNDKNLVTNKKNINFVELFKKNKEDIETVETLDPDLIYIQPGYSLIKFDPITHKIVIKSQSNNNCLIEEKLIESEKELSYDEKEISYKILEELIKLHQRRTQEYIELNGYDMWEKMFKFPNWEEEDYSYSDSDDEYDEEEDDFEEYDDEFYYEY